MERADVIILGGGLVGLSLALALDRHGLGSIIVDPADPATQIAPSYDGRSDQVRPRTSPRNPHTPCLHAGHSASTKLLNLRTDGAKMLAAAP